MRAGAAEPRSCMLRPPVAQRAVRAAPHPKPSPAMRAQAQLELAGTEVERAHGRMAVLERQRERAALAPQAPGVERDEARRRDEEDALRGELRTQVAGRRWCPFVG